LTRSYCLSSCNLLICGMHVFACIFLALRVCKCSRCKTLAALSCEAIASLGMEAILVESGALELNIEDS